MTAILKHNFTPLYLKVQDPFNSTTGSTEATGLKTGCARIKFNNNGQSGLELKRKALVIAYLVDDLGDNGLLY